MSTTLSRRNNNQRENRFEEDSNDLTFNDAFIMQDAPGRDADESGSQSDHRDGSLNVHKRAIVTATHTTAETHVSTKKRRVDSKTAQKLNLNENPTPTPRPKVKASTGNRCRGPTTGCPRPRPRPRTTIAAQRKAVRGGAAGKLQKHILTEKYPYKKNEYDSDTDEDRYDPGFKRLTPKKLRDIDKDLKPISRLEDMFADMADKAMDFGLADLLSGNRGVQINIGTMCSGTESPLLALQMVADVLKQRYGKVIQVHHTFSVEIETKIQGYIIRNFDPPTLFRDMREMAESRDGQASTAYGRHATIPGGLHILVAGCSCVDFSNLNSSKRTLADKGESAETFRSAVVYMARYRPAVVIFENVKSAPFNAMQVIIENNRPAMAKILGSKGSIYDDIWAGEQGKVYKCKWVHVDSKDYYLPQTRNRGYMVCVKVSMFKSTRDAKYAVQKWAQLMRVFERKASSPIDAFLLPDRHVMVRKARLSYRQSIETKRNYKWDAGKIRYRDYRQSRRLGSGRPLTDWSKDGVATVPEGWWHDFLRAQSERVLDTFEIAYLRSFVRGFDPQSQASVIAPLVSVLVQPLTDDSRVWELSQNVDRAQDTAPLGITSCITPTGTLFHTVRGGPIVGAEALRLQGIPLNRIHLTRETHRELQRLAGNAMSSTVVGAALLSGLIATFEMLKLPESNQEQDCSAFVKEKNCTHFLDRDHLDFARIEEDLEGEELDVASLCRLANNSVSLCDCESEIQFTGKSFLLCRLCGHTCCTTCAGVPSHNYEPISMDSIRHRQDPMPVHSILMDLLPMVVSFSGFTNDHLEALLTKAKDMGSDKGEEDLKIIKKAASSLQESEIKFQSLKRSKSWVATYDAEFCKLELTLSKSTAFWQLYGKPASTEAGNSKSRWLLEVPIARMAVEGRSLLSGKWQVCVPARSAFDVDIEGAGILVSAWGRRIGITHEKHINYKVWPHLTISKPIFSKGNKNEIEIEVESESVSEKEKENEDQDQGQNQVEEEDEISNMILGADISGLYILMQNCGTAFHSLYARIDKTSSPLYLFLDPERIGHPEDDSFVFATDTSRLEYGEFREKVAELNSGWRPNSVNTSKVVVTNFGDWLDCDITLEHIAVKKMVTCSVAKNDIKLSVTKENPEITGLCHVGAVILAYTVYSADLEKFGWHEELSLEANRSDHLQWHLYSWLIQRPRKLNGFSHEWRPVHLPPSQQAISVCRTCAPQLPSHGWTRLKRKLQPYEDAREAGIFERAMKDRPSPFVLNSSGTSMSGESAGNFEILFNLTVLVHKALSQLPNRSLDGPIDAVWRMNVRFHDSTKCTLDAFKLRNTKDEPLINFAFPTSEVLRVEQLQSLSWMLRQESEDAPAWMEQHIEEAMAPQLKWLAEVRLRHPVKVHGGVLADKVGYGKTVTTLGLIWAQWNKDRAFKEHDVDKRIRLKATLIVLPKTLASQWEGQIRQFLGGKPIVLVIRDLIQLGRCTIKQFMAADIILLSWSLFESDAYWRKFSLFAALAEGPPSGRAFSAYLDQALSRMSDHVTKMKSGISPQAFADDLKKQRNEFMQDKTRKRLVPIKRQKGSRYLGYHGEEEDDDGDVELDDHGKFLANMTKAASWKDIKCPMLHIFSFGRVVIDEYTYCTEKLLTIIKSLTTGFRWILSGTPRIEDFATVQTMAEAIAVNLGVLDDDPNLLTSQSVQALRRDRTGLETIRAFAYTHTHQWHAARQSHAQDFLNQFVRQNSTARKISQKTGYLMLDLNLVEKQYYWRISQIVRLMEEKLMPGASGKDPELKELFDKLRASATRSSEESLMKASSASQYHYYDGRIRDRSSTGLQERWSACMDDLASYACEALLLDKKRQYIASFPRRCKIRNDSEETESDLLEDWVDDFDIESMDDEKLREGVVHILHWADLAIRGHPDVFETNCELAIDIDDDDIEVPTGFRARAQITPDRLRKMMEDITEKMRRLIEEVSSYSEASGRFDFDNTAYQVDKLATIDKAVQEQCLLPNNHTQGSLLCPLCSDRCSALDIVIIFTCGHMMCRRCFLSTTETCPFSKCDAAIKTSNIKTAADIADTTNVMKINGTKMGTLIRLITRVIPQDDQILFFVQYEDLMQQIVRGFKRAGITYWALGDGTIGHTVMMDDFQNNTSPTRKRVLILNSSRVSAAGVNLVNANHVIFATPPVTNLESQFSSSYQQCVGRAVRHGQVKPVFIYNIMMIYTFDVDLYQQRHGFKWVVRNDEVTCVANHELTEEEKEVKNTFGEAWELQSLES